MGVWVMKSRLMQVGLFREIVLGVIKHTSYEHFVAGADTEETGRTVKKLWESGLRGMLDYGLEHAIDNESCDINAQEFIKTVESTQSLPPSSVSCFYISMIFQIFYSDFLYIFSIQDSLFIFLDLKKPMYDSYHEMILIL